LESKKNEWLAVQDRIHSELAKIEDNENLTILLAVESGSRAWGFASPDSDYDVRFIYIRPRDYYLKLEKRRDVCEWVLDETLDINGWDFDKTLRLLRSSNPTLFEWMSSPIVYRKHPAFDSLMENSDEFFLSIPGLHHYLHMAEGNYREFLKGDMVKLKKYFYVLRPILACYHILSTGTPPPMRFSELVEAQMDQALIPEINALLKQKGITSEMGMAPKVVRINEYIEASLAYLSEEISKQSSDKPKKPWGVLNDIFLRALDFSGSVTCNV